MNEPGNNGRVEGRLPVAANGEVVVKIGELGLASKGAVLRTLLGSCIGLAIFDQQRQIGGLAHIMLAQSLGREDAIAKYADTAVPELIHQIVLAGGNLKSLRAKIAGGADMFGISRTLTVGQQNVVAVRDCLKARNVTLMGDHCGGTQGRRMYFYPDSGRVRIEIVGQDSVEL